MANSTANQSGASAQKQPKVASVVQIAPSSKEAKAKTKKRSLKKKSGKRARKAPAVKKAAASKSSSAKQSAKPSQASSAAKQKKTSSDAFAFNNSMDSWFEGCTGAGELAQEIGEEVTSCANDIIAENMEALQDSFTCRTASDFMDLQQELIRATMSRSMEAALRISELASKRQSWPTVGIDTTEFTETITKLLGDKK
ncbi:MAG: phasin family protein [Hyphomicrobiales bacterium]|nr:phasin family protein [Rickettsiales bacterium]MCP5361983.1 phasin family protein [Hyphomicrobiales bacterium]